VGFVLGRRREDAHQANCCHVTLYHDAFHGQSNVYWPKIFGRYIFVKSHYIVSFVMGERERERERVKKVVNVGW
jgi:hypothetical protein